MTKLTNYYRIEYAVKHYQEVIIAVDPQIDESEIYELIDDNINAIENQTNGYHDNYSIYRQDTHVELYDSSSDYIEHGFRVVKDLSGNLVLVESDQSVNP